MRIKLLGFVFSFFILTLFLSAAYEETAFVFDYDMVLVDGGVFRMGATSEQGDHISLDEKPAHRVKIKSFYMGRYEVTQAQWKAVMKDNPSFFRGDKNLPVEKVSWNDVQIFIQKVNEKTGKKYRLPTEAEWEYAARGGNKCGGYKFSGSNYIDEIAWCNKNSEEKTHPVGTVSYHNELGIYDMCGNVAEWCGDWYGLYTEKGPDENPTGPKNGRVRVVRGGAWNYYPDECRVAKRYNAYPGVRLREIGFRLVLDN